jgi:N-acetylmuramoyl-L-alanine amidase
MKLRLGAILLLAATMVPAMPAAARAATRAETLYARALDKERALREADARATLLQLRGLVKTYAAIVRRFPRSGYSDNALWQGGNVALLAYERFGQAADRRTAERMLQQLKRGYPTSSLVKRVDDALESPQDQARPGAAVQEKARPGAAVQDEARPRAAVHNEASPAAAARPAKPLARLRARAPWPVALTPSIGVHPTDGDEETSDVPVQTAGGQLPVAESGTAPVVPRGPVTIRDIKRTSIDGGARITIEMDGESSYHAEELDRPRRVFFDLKETRPVASLLDATLKFDEDLVREVRLGRHPRNTTRIVFDMQGVDSYSVFTLYNPFRMVIDFKAGASPASIAAATRPAEARSDPAPLPLIASSTPPALSAAVPAKASRELAETVSKPLASHAVASSTAIPPALPSANADGKFSLSRQLGLGVSRIVIDAGHGGHDPGAQATGINESELTLDVALRLSRLLEKQPGMDVVMTRDTDVFVPLEERTALANREGADLFLSIHANASRRSTARGIETYFLNFASNPEAEAVAARENSASARAMHSLPEIVRAIALNNKIDESRDFADMVQRSMVRRLTARNKQVRDLGVKQAPFVVLIGASMPSVLAEISFVTNRQEGQLLKTGAYRQQIAEALFDAVVRYQQSLKKWKTGTMGVGARQ